MATSNLRREREALSWSQVELARRAGLSALTIGRVESGRSCSLASRRRILLALGIDPADQARIFGVPLWSETILGSELLAAHPGGARVREVGRS